MSMISPGSSTTQQYSELINRDPVVPDTQSTNVYLDVLQEADVFDDNFIGAGEITQQELANYGQKLQQRAQFLSSVGNSFMQMFGENQEIANFINAHIQDVSNKFEATKNLFINYDRFKVDTTVQEFLLGDLNNDRVVDDLDAGTLMTHLNSADGDSNYNQLADFNADGLINSTDFSILSSRFGAPAVDTTTSAITDATLLAVAAVDGNAASISIEDLPKLPPPEIVITPIVYPTATEPYPVLRGDEKVLALMDTLDAQTDIKSEESIATIDALGVRVGLLGGRADLELKTYLGDFAIINNIVADTALAALEEKQIERERLLNLPMLDETTPALLTNTKFAASLKRLAKLAPASSESRLAIEEFKQMTRNVSGQAQFEVLRVIDLHEMRMVESFAIGLVASSAGLSGAELTAAQAQLDGFNTLKQEIMDRGNLGDLFAGIDLTTTI